MKPDINRRKFMGAAVASGLVDHRSRGTSWAAADTSPPATRSRWPTSAWARRASANWAACWPAARSRSSPSAIPNTDSNDYVEWGKNSIRNRIRDYLGNPAWRENDDGCPGGREVGREVVDTYYAKQRGAGHFKACRAYADFRELLEKEKDLDAVKIMTPDHLHATIAVAAMKKGKHVLVHKPLANRMYEGAAGRRNGPPEPRSPRTCWPTAPERATPLIAEQDQGRGHRHAAGNPQLDEPARSGRNTRRSPRDKPPVPKGFDWDLWLGPALDRPYHPHYTHTVFRGWYDFGGGSMADMGIYSLWPVFAGAGSGRAARAPRPGRPTPARSSTASAGR